MKQKRTREKLTSTFNPHGVYEFRAKLLQAQQDYRNKRKTYRRKDCNKAIGGCIEFFIFTPIMLYGGFRGLTTPPTSPFHYVWMVTSVLLFFCFVLRSIVRENCFWCPGCQSRLTKSDPVPNAPITFTCDDCEVIWDIGYLHPSPDD